MRVLPVQNQLFFLLLIVYHGKTVFSQGYRIHPAGRFQPVFQGLSVHLAEERAEIHNGQAHPHRKQQGGDHPRLLLFGKQSHNGKSNQNQRKDGGPDPALAQNKPIEPGKALEGLFIRLYGNDDFEGHTHSSFHA